MFDKERYSRHLMIGGFDEVHQERLTKSKVLVVGAGGLGAPIVQYLTSSGVGEIGIVEHDTVSLSNLQRQILFKEKHVGVSKGELTKQWVEDLNSSINCNLYDCWLNEDNVEQILTGYDLVIGATDNFNSRKLMDLTCCKLKIPYMHGSIMEFSGQVALFMPEQQIRYSDLFPMVDDDTVSHSIGVVGALPGVVGSIMAIEAIKYITGLGSTIAGKMILYDGLNSSQEIVSFD